MPYGASSFGGRRKLARAGWSVNDAGRAVVTPAPIVRGRIVPFFRSLEANRRPLVRDVPPSTPGRSTAPPETVARATARAPFDVFAAPVQPSTGDGAASGGAPTGGLTDASLAQATQALTLNDVAKGSAFVLGIVGLMAAAPALAGIALAAKLAGVAVQAVNVISSPRPADETFGQKLAAVFGLQAPTTKDDVKLEVPPTFNPTLSQALNVDPAALDAALASGFTLDNNVAAALARAGFDVFSVDSGGHAIGHPGATIGQLSANTPVGAATGNAPGISTDFGNSPGNTSGPTPTFPDDVATVTDTGITQGDTGAPAGSGLGDTSGAASGTGGAPGGQSP